MRSRGTVAIVGALALVAGVLLVRGLRGDDESAAPSAPVATPTTTSSPSARTHVPAPERERAVGDQPVPVAIDPSKAPSLDAPVSKPAPPQVPFDRAETIEKREADLQLLEDTRVRLEADLTAAKAAGDASAVQELEVRIKRLGSLKQQRSKELETIRAGGPLPP